MIAVMKRFFNGLSQGEGQGKDNLMLVPIFREEVGTPRNYLLLDEAMEAGCFRVSEVSLAGSVNTLLVENTGEKDVLILDGEELVGAKQNRMVNATILVAAKTSLKIPVSCVERGRWNYQSDEFKKSEVFGYTSLRRQKTSQVSENLSMNSSFSADQSAVWEEIDRKHVQMSSRSITGAVHDVYQNMKVELEGFTRDLNPSSNQIGIAVFINDYFNCMDVFTHPDVLARLWDKLLTSYAMEAAELGQHGKRRSTPKRMDEVLDALKLAEVREFPSVGRGTDLRLKGTHLIGAALSADDILMHLALFQSFGAAKKNETYARPSQRRHHVE